MEPRRQTSLKWTLFPSEITDLIQTIVREELGAATSSKTSGKIAGKIIVEGRIYPEELILRLGLIENGQLKQNNYESSVDYKAGKDRVVDLIQMLLEAAFSIMEGHRNDENADLPREWQKFELRKVAVYLRYTTINSDLEAAADRLLGESTTGLVQHTTKAELEEILDRLGLADDRDAPTQ